MRRRIRGTSREYLEAILVAAVIAVVLRAFVVQAYRIPSDSMMDTLQVGDFILVNKFAYHFRDPRPNDVVVFKYPLNPSKDFVKRCIAVEGQVVEIRDKTVYVDNKPQPNATGVRYTDTHVISGDLSNRDNFGPMTVPPGCVFVLGDNRDDSKDSRTWGFLDKSMIRGNAVCIYWSWAPDPNAPRWESPYLWPLLAIPFYNLAHFPSRVRFDRIGTTL
ncbi:MAG: signal peptidase I [candidate division Zixibacteria bacterium]|nr:signal peptidase I [candidate division Zixibacteria bacterium]